MNKIGVLLAVGCALAVTTALAAERAMNLGIPAIALFPYTQQGSRDETGSEALNPDNLVCRAIRAIKKERPDLLIMADSRRSLQDYPPVCLKMNRAELSRLAGRARLVPLREVGPAATALAREKGSYCFVTLAEKGMVGAGPDGAVEWLAALPVRGKIDVVGAGDCVTANLTAALASGARLREPLQLANAAASIVVHKLGTTGTASVAEIRRLLFSLRHHHSGRTASPSIFCCRFFT